MSNADKDLSQLRYDVAALEVQRDQAQAKLDAMREDTEQVARAEVARRFRLMNDARFFARTYGMRLDGALAGADERMPSEELERRLILAMHERTDGLPREVGQ